MSTQPNVKREHIPELNLVRAIAILGVLSVHATSTATALMKESAYFYFYNFVNTFMRFGTPTFILLSSFVLFYSYYNRPLDRKLIASFYKRRLLYIILPYVIFSVVYFVYARLASELPVFSLDGMGWFLQKLVRGEVSFHLYFIFISIQFYLLFPIVLWAAKRWPRLAYGFIPFGFIAQWIFVALVFYDWWPVDNKASWAPTYFSFFFTGAFLGIYFPKLKQWFAMTKENATVSRVIVWMLVIVAWLAFALTHVTVYFNIYKHNKTYFGLLYDFLWNFHTYFSAFALLLLSFFIYRHLPAFISKTLYRIGQLSFGIYLIHVLIMHLYERYVPTFGEAWLTHLRYFGIWVVMLAGSWLIVALVSRYVPFGWVLFGNVPREGLRLRADGDKAGASVKGKMVAARPITIDQFEQ